MNWDWVEHRPLERLYEAIETGKQHGGSMRFAVTRSPEKRAAIVKTMVDSLSNLDQRERAWAVAALITFMERESDGSSETD